MLRIQRSDIAGVFAAVVILVVNTGRATEAQDSISAQPLDEAVRLFNSKAQADPVGKDQPLLTVDEVVGAIRWFNRAQAPVTDSEFAAFKQIAETNLLPPGGSLEVITGFIPGDGFSYSRWSVRVLTKRASNAGTFAYAIRERTISSAADRNVRTGTNLLKGSVAGLKPKTSVAIDPPNAAALVGRYKLDMTHGFYMYDTTTGECWFWNTEAWEPLGSPRDSTPTKK